MERGKFYQFADKASRVPTPKAEDLVVDPDDNDFDGDFDVNLVVKVKDGATTIKSCTSIT